MTRMATVCLALGGLLLCGAGAGQAQEEPPPAKDYSGAWIPAASGTLRVMGYKGNGLVGSTVGFSSVGTANQEVALFEFAGEIQTPALTGIPTEPRLVAVAGIRLSPPQELLPGKIGEFIPGEPERAIQLAIANPPFPDPASFNGQGSEVSATLQNFGWFMQAGVVLGLPHAESRVRARPYFSYTGEQVDLVGRVVAVTGVGPNYTVNRPTARSTEMFHYVGGGLELEFQLAQTQNTRMSIFATADYVVNVGQSRVALATSQAIFGYATEPSRVRGGAGFRLAFQEIFGQ